MFQNNTDLNKNNTNKFQSDYRMLEEANDGIYSTFKTQYQHSSTNDMNNSKSLEFFAQDLLSDSDKYDDFDLGGTNSDTSSLLQLPVFDINNQNSKQTESKKETKDKKLTGKKRKKTDDTTKQDKVKVKKNKQSNQRRNIKKIFTEEKLNESTLRALNEEKERIQRLTTNLNDDLPVQINDLELNKDLLNSSSINNSTSVMDKSSDQSIYVIEDDINIPANTNNTSSIKNNEASNNNSNINCNQYNHHQQQQQQQQFSLTDQKIAYFANYNTTFYQNLLANNNRQSIPPPPPPPHPINIKEIDLETENLTNNNNNDEDDDVDDDDDDIIECSKEEDDDCRIISESERQQDEQAISKQKLRGIHMNDEKNVPNANGQVLVNVNHSAEDNDVYLLPYLAKNVKPHQVGGIRFMYDNIVETLTRIKDKTIGFGCILAHAMGLGKTLQVISFIEVFLRCTQSKRVLCIVPINTIQNWQSEFNNWLPENGQQKLDNDTIINYRRPFKVFMINDFSRTIKQRTEVILEWTNNGGVLLIGYEMFRTLITNSKTTKQSQSKKNSSKNETSDIADEEELLQKQNIIKESLISPCLVVCDEGHRIKNNAANIAKTLQTIKTKRRVVLTGYPLQNNLIEYWCMVDFVRPSYLGTKAEFCNMFERPIMNGQCMDSTREDVKLMRFRAHVLHSLLEGFVQRRGHDVFLNTLPKKQEYIILLKLSSIQKEFYLAFMEAIGAMSSNEKTNPLRSFAICCKIWNHPDVLYKYFVDKESEIDLDLPELQQTQTTKKNQKQASNYVSTFSSASSTALLYQEDGFNPFGSTLNDNRTNNKNYYDPDWATRLMETYKPNSLESGAKFLLSFSIIEESIKCGDKILLFSQSLLSLDLIEEYLQKINVPNTNEKWKKYKNYYRLDGSTPGVERERLINTFNKPNNELWLFLLSTRAGCLGINLIGANRVIVLDASWNPCHDAQAVCRVYRYGQKKNCYIYRLIADHTMEKKIYDRQISKQSMSDRVIDEIQGENHFTRTEVEKLIHFVKEDVPSADLSNMPNKFNDIALINSCMKNSHVITKEPFTHESLLIDKKEYQLSEREKALAFREYQHDKKYFPYTRNSSITSTAASLFYQRYGNIAQSSSNSSSNNNNYSNYNSLSVNNIGVNISTLSNSSTSSNISGSSNNSSNLYKSNFYNSIINDGTNSNNNKDLDFNLNRNITPVTNSFLNQNPRFSSTNDLITNNSPTITKYLNSSDHLNLNNNNNNTSEKTNLSNPQSNLKDVKISRFTATSQLVIPTNTNNEHSSEQENIIIQSGQTVFLLQTPKGCYLRTADKKYIALRGQTFEELLTNNNNNNNIKQPIFTNTLQNDSSNQFNNVNHIQKQNQSYNNINQQQTYSNNNINNNNDISYFSNSYQTTNTTETNPNESNQYDILANSINSLNETLQETNILTNKSPDFNLNDNSDFLINNISSNGNVSQFNNTNNSQYPNLNIDSF